LTVIALPKVLSNGLPLFSLLAVLSKRLLGLFLAMLGLLTGLVALEILVLLRNVWVFFAGAFSIKILPELLLPPLDSFTCSVLSSRDFML
jgi:hypothetical protein